VQQARYISVGIRLECVYRGVLRSFIVKSITGPDHPDRNSLVARLETLYISPSATSPHPPGVPIVYCMSRSTKISFSSSKDVIQSPSSQDAVTFSSIGGLKEQIEILRDMVEMPLLKPHLFIRFGMKPPRGVLLYGPPGTGKTLLLKAIANEVQAHVLTVNGPSVISKYQGETESTLRSIFSEAYERQPSIIFIDEIDALAPKRGGENESALDVTDGRVVATLLTLMDGMEGSGRVVVVAATNRPNAIDPALRRPGRFDKELEIGIPDANARLEILRLQLWKMPHMLLDTYVQSVAAKTHGYVGADLIALCTEAGMRCIKSGVKNNIPENSMKIDRADIESALLVVRPSAMREVSGSRIPLTADLPRNTKSQMGRHWRSRTYQTKTPRSSRLANHTSQLIHQIRHYPTKGDPTLRSPGMFKDPHR
jgi:AAA+ superfamily predicted ATPase